MAGHSKFKNIMHRKGAQDARRAKKFARLTKELQVAVRGGTDPSSNPRLRSALSACRAVNIPKDNIERVIKKAEDGENSNLEEIRYEGYAPGGVALIVDALTDNRNRTAAEVRSSFTKYGGNLGETGSVSFMFNNVGQIVYKKNIMRYYIGDVGALNQIIHIWQFEDDNARRELWKIIYKDKDFIKFATEFRPLVLTQENKIMTAAPWTPYQTY